MKQRQKSQAELDIEKRQRFAIRRARFNVKWELAYRGARCPGCWKPVYPSDGEFHHALFRERDAITHEQKLLLYDVRNGLVVHHACHLGENKPGFRTNSAIIVIHQAGGPENIRQYCAGLAEHFEVLTIPKLWVELLDDWYSLGGPCPTCLGDRVRDGTCLSCLWRMV